VSSDRRGVNPISIFFADSTHDTMVGSKVPLLPFLVALSSPLALAFAPAPSPDWLEAELTVHNFPRCPSPDLSAERVAICCLRSLQLVDTPSPSAGLDRIYDFFTWQCRNAVTASTRDSVSPEAFRERAALSPVLQPIIGATNIKLGESTISPGTSNARGDIVSYPVTVYVSEVLAFQHKSGMIRDRVAAGPPRLDIVMRLEKARRPPMEGCWLVREITDVRFANGGQGWSRHEGV